MLIAFTATLLVWYLLQVALSPSEQSTPRASDVTPLSLASSTEGTTESVNAAVGTKAPAITEEVPAYNGLTPAETERLRSFGIDPARITPAVIECARKVVGEERLVAYQAGAEPTVSETLRLFGCLGE